MSVVCICVIYCYALCLNTELSLCSCGKCNQFGLEKQCCGDRYHIVLRAKRIPPDVRAKLSKMCFTSFEEVVVTSNLNRH